MPLYPCLPERMGSLPTPTTVGKEMANFVARFKQQKISLETVKILGKFNGAVGNYNAHEVSYPEIDWEKISKDFCEYFRRGTQSLHYTNRTA